MNSSNFTDIEKSFFNSIVVYKITCVVKERSGGEIRLVKVGTKHALKGKCVFHLPEIMDVVSARFEISFEGDEETPPSIVEIPKYDNTKTGMIRIYDLCETKFVDRFQL